MYSQSLSTYDTKFKNLGITKVECAHLKVTAAAGHSGTTTFTFSSQFKQKPFVFVTIEHRWADTLQCTVESCSVSEVAIRLYNGSSQNLNDVPVNMIAVEYI